jgi:hypothetical protein
VQHGMDKVIEWGFGQMQKAADEKKATAKEAQAEHERVAQVKRAAKKTLHFLGETGKAYYDTYRDLKKKEGN